MEVREIGRLVHDYRRAKLLFLAARYELFGLVEGRGLTLEEACKALGTRHRPTGIFLNALVAAGLLGKKGGRYVNAPGAARFLVKGSPDYFGHILKFQDILWPAWGELGRVLKDGAPRLDIQGWMESSSDFTEEYIQGMRRVALGPAAEVARRLSRAQDRMMLDVGGGPGTFSVELLKLNEDLLAEIIDLPATLCVARGILAGQPEGARVKLARGDYRRLRLSPGTYDLILLSHITHNEGPAFNRRLARECFAALKAGGRLAVHDFMTDPGGVTPAFSAMFAAHMMSFTREGSVYGAQEYEGWLNRAGFRKIRRHAVCPRSETPSMLVVGEKA